MAIERIKEFTIDLGDLVKTRLDNFVKSRNKVHALEEATFQRSIVDNDLSYQEQLDYRNSQLKLEEAKTFPDIEFINELKTSISALKKMVRHRKFRDNYFIFLQDLASGKKALEDHLEFLKNSLADETLDREIKDELRDQYVKTIDAKRTQDRQIIDAQITFNQKDKTAESIDKAINLVKSQLLKPDIQKDEALRTSYEMQLRTLEKERMEIGIEDKMNWMAINLISKDRKNPSLWKLETFAGFRDKAGVDMPVNIGGVRYASEQEYWQITMNNYIQSDFGNDYVKENKGEAALIWNKLGLLPDTYIKNLITNNNIIRTHPELQEFQQVIASSIQDSITNTLALKAKDLTAKYYLDKPDIATESDYQKAKQELENLKVIFGEDYSLSPDIQAVETKLIAKRVQTTKDILATAAEYAKAEGITLQEAIKKYGPTAAIEVSAETFKEKTPMEAAEEIAEEGAKAPELYKKKEELEEKVEEAKKKVEEAKKAPPAPAPTPPAPTPPTGTRTITIPSGATLSGLAAKYGTTVSKLMFLNPSIKDPNKIYAGAKLYVPVAKAAPPPKPKPEPKPEPTPTPSAPEPTYHIVKAGETLWGISQKYLGSGAKWKQLKTPEGVGFTEETAKRLRIGQKISDKREAVCY